MKPLEVAAGEANHHQQHGEVEEDDDVYHRSIPKPPSLVVGDTSTLRLSQLG